MHNTEIKNAGLKVTLPRVKILEILSSAEKHHLSAEAIYQQLKEEGEEIGLATVYRVLTQFENASLVVRHNFEGAHAVFELESEHHHDHLVCVKCNTVIEFVDDLIEERQAKIAADANFKMTDHTLIIYGLCRDCQQSTTDANDE